MKDFLVWSWRDRQNRYVLYFNALCMSGIAYMIIDVMK